MQNFQNEIKELIAETASWIKQEDLPIKNWINTDSETFSYYKNFAREKQGVRIQETGVRSQESGARRQETVLRNQEAGDNRQEASPKASQPIPQPKPEKQHVEKPVNDKKNSQRKDAETQRKEVKGLLDLEFLAKPSDADFSSFKKVIHEHFPHYQILDDIPDDTHSKNTISPNLGINIPPYVIVAFDNNPKHLLFLRNISRAMNMHQMPSIVISAQSMESENGWDAMLSSAGLQLIIASDNTVSQFPLLLKHYKESAKQGKCFFGKVPLLRLADLSLYFKEPQLKATLWEALCKSNKA